MNYTYGRDVTDAVNNTSPFIGLTTADWQPRRRSSERLPDGITYNIPLFMPDADKVAATGGGRLLTNYDGYCTQFNGIEVAMNKRMSDRWMMRLACGIQQPDRRLRHEPCRSTETATRRATDTFPLISGGQLAPRSAGSGSGDVFVNQRWNFNLNGAYQLPWQHGSRPATCSASRARRTRIFRNAALGREGTVRILVDAGARFGPVR